MNWYSSCRSFLAPMKFDPLSVWMDDGSPLLEMNLFRVARNAAVVRSLTASMCTALVLKHTKMAKYAFTRTGFLVWPFFKVKGPA